MITHEAFHVHQNRMAPDKGANEMHVRLYPCLSVKNNVGVALEGTALAEFLCADNAEKERAAAIAWLAVRQDRRADLSPEAVAYEDGNEFSEGLAVSTELRLAQVLQGRRVPDQRWLAQGFRGFADMGEIRGRLIRKLLETTHGTLNVNNDRFGTAPVRFRLYYSGMAIAAILDRLDATWKDHVFEKGVTLTGLATQALDATPGELRAALEKVRNGHAFERLVAEKTQLEVDGLEDTNAMLEAIDHGPKTTLEVDYRGLGDVHVAFAFTPFGVRAVDDNYVPVIFVPLKDEQRLFGVLESRFGWEFRREGDSSQNGDAGSPVDLTGEVVRSKWRPSLPQYWQMEGNEIVSRGGRYSKWSYCEYTGQDFVDFELTADVLYGTGSNGGVCVRASRGGPGWYQPLRIPYLSPLDRSGIHLRTRFGSKRLQRVTARMDRDVRLQRRCDRRSPSMRFARQMRMYAG